MARNDAPITKAVQRWIRSKIAHRNGIKLFGKNYDQITVPVGFKIKDRKIVYKKILLDNHIPATIEDVIEQIGLCTKADKLHPQILARHKQEYGWTVILKLPPGISYSNMLDKKEYFETAVNGWVEMEWRNGRVVMDILTDDLPHMIPYEFDPEPYLKTMEIPIPIGYTRKGLLVIDLCDLPHFLVAGLTKFGKTNFVRLVLHSILPYCLVAIIDLKRLSFSYLGEQCKIAKTEEQALKLLQYLNREHDRRTSILESKGIEKVQELPNHHEVMPYLVLIIDELAQLESDEAIQLIKRLAQLARSSGIHLIAATQRPSAKVLEGDAKSQFDGRISFRMSSAIDSRIILDSSHAVQIPPIPGRALYRHGIDFHEVQTMFLSKKQAEQLGHGRGWGYEPSQNRLPAR